MSIKRNLQSGLPSTAIKQLKKNHSDTSLLNVFRKTGTVLKTKPLV